MGTGSGRIPPPCNSTLPETNTGWVEESGVVVVRGGTTALDDVPEEPDEPRCAAANCASKTMPTAAYVLKREELKPIATSFGLARQAGDFLTAINGSHQTMPRQR
jgi:hypothetical protein